MNGNLSQDIRAIFVETLCNECINLFIRAYNLALIDKLYSNQWEEDSFTAHLFERYLKKLQIEHRWIINPQVPIYNDKIALAKVLASTASKPDLKFQKYVSDGKEPFSFHIEAKNLSEHKWQKVSRSIVDASEQRGRYIKTGIDNFKNENYLLGCLAGYVVEGDVKNIVLLINERLKKWGRESEILEKLDINEGFISKHNSISGNEIKLKHIFLKFE